MGDKISSLAVLSSGTLAELRGGMIDEGSFLDMES